VVKCLPSKHETLSSSYSTTKTKRKPHAIIWKLHFITVDQMDVETAKEKWHYINYACLNVDLKPMLFNVNQPLSLTFFFFHNFIDSKTSLSKLHHYIFLVPEKKRIIVYLYLNIKTIENISWDYWFLLVYEMVECEVSNSIQFINLN
jgi:hypothetical protein